MMIGYLYVRTLTTIGKYIYSYTHSCQRAAINYNYMREYKTHQRYEFPHSNRYTINLIENEVCHTEPCSHSDTYL